MAKKLLSEQFREQLQNLGSSLATHTRSLEEHFDKQEAFLALRHHELEEAATEMLPAAKPPYQVIARNCTLYSPAGKFPPAKL